ncbi:hypothetical protein Droror1_Dr00006145 [Drosera rotundifolia]
MARVYVGNLDPRVSERDLEDEFCVFGILRRHETEDRLRVHITDAEKSRWEVPYTLLPREAPPPLKQNIVLASKISGNELIFSFTADPFSFSVKRKSNRQTVFDTLSSGLDPYNNLVFKDQYIEVSTKLPTDASLYVLGENTQPHGIKLYPNDPYTLWTTDQSAINLNMDLLSKTERRMKWRARKNTDI